MFTILFCPGGNQGSERQSHLTKAPQRLSSGARIWIQIWLVFLPGIFYEFTEGGQQGALTGPQNPLQFCRDPSSHSLPTCSGHCVLLLLQGPLTGPACGASTELHASPGKAAQGMSPLPQAVTYQWCSEWSPHPGWRQRCGSMGTSEGGNKEGGEGQRRRKDRAIIHWAQTASHSWRCSSYGILELLTLRIPEQRKLRSPKSENHRRLES